MTFGVTVNGYVVKTLADINSEAELDLAKVVDPVSGSSLQANLSDPTDLVSQITAISLEQVADGILVDQAAYNQFNPAGATGAALSTLVVINGIARQESSASTVLLDFIGTPNVTVPSTENIEVTDVNKAFIWLVTEDIVFSGIGIATGVEAKCQTLGPITANANTLTSLVLTNANILAVDNLADATVGTNEEADTALRSRRDQSTETPAIGIPAGIAAAIRNLTGVTFTVVYNNILLVPDSNGIPAKTIAAVVVGGDEIEIAQTIFSRNGCAGYDGNVSVVFQDTQGFTNNVQFFRPTPIPIFVKVEVTITEGDVFPADGAAQITSAILAYAAGGAPALGITDGFDTNGFTPGADILVSRLYTPVNSVPGHKVDEILIGLSAPPIITDEIIIDFDDVGEFEDANIEVVVNGL